MSGAYYHILFHERRDIQQFKRILPLQDSELFEELVVQSKLLTACIDPTVPHVYELKIGLPKDFSREYQPGDTIGILPENHEKEICEILHRLDLNDKIDQIVQITGTKIPAHVPVNGSTLKEIFTNNLDVRSVPSKLFLKSLATQTDDPTEIERLNEICKAGNSEKYSEFINTDGKTLLKILTTLPKCQPTLGTLIKFLPSLKPRPYSIASANVKSSEFTIIFSVRRGAEKGVCSGYLEKSCQTGTFLPSIQFYFRKPTDFRLPSTCQKQHIIMIATGAGIAPFMGFLEEYACAQAADLMTLYYGCRYQHQDFLYKSKLEDYQRGKILKNLYTSFSRDEPKKVYIQDRIKDNWKELYYLITKGALIYVCGDVKTMMADVKRAILALLIKSSGLSEEDAKHFLELMEKSKRYIEDKWV